MRPPAAGADAVRGPRSASGSPGPARPGAAPTRSPAATPEEARPFPGRQLRHADPVLAGEHATVVRLHVADDGQAAAVPDAVQRAIEHRQPPLVRDGLGDVRLRRHASGAGAADGAASTSESTAYGSRRQPSRWSGSRTGRPPVKMAVAPLVTWSKRAGSSPPIVEGRPAAQLPARPHADVAVGARCGSAAPRCVGCRRRKATRRGRSAVRHERPLVLDQLALNGMRGVVRRLEAGSHRWRRRPRRRWCRSGLPGHWGFCTRLRCDACADSETARKIQHRPPRDPV